MSDAELQPEDSGYSRFLYFIRYLARNDFYIIIDDHLAVDTTVIDDPGAYLLPQVMLSGNPQRSATTSCCPHTAMSRQGTHMSQCA